MHTNRFHSYVYIPHDTTFTYTLTLGLFISIMHTILYVFVGIHQRQCFRVELGTTFDLLTSYISFLSCFVAVWRQKYTEWKKTALSKWKMVNVR